MKKRSFIFILLIILVLFMASCNNNSNGGVVVEQVVLPAETSIEQKSADEVIYVSIDQSGRVASMKASNHLKNTEFTYYEQHGVFYPDGHINVTSGGAKIEIKDGKAYIPSTHEYKNFFYTLNIDHNYYQELLPFYLTTKYKLNGYTVGYQSLAGATGRVEIEIDVKANTSEQLAKCYKKLFAAQIQVPINLNNADIINSPGSMANIITGSTATLAYMVMPGEDAKFIIELDVSNFKFAGLQATYQPFDISSLASNYLSLDGLDIEAFSKLFSGLDTVITEFTDAYNEINPLFTGISSLEELVTNDEFSLIEELIGNLTGREFSLGLRQPQQALRLSLENRSTIVSEYTTLADNIESTIGGLEESYNALISNLNSLRPKVLKVSSYPKDFRLLAEIINSLEAMQLEFNKVDELGELSLEVIASNKEVVIEVFNNASASNKEVQRLFQELLIKMQPFGYHLEDLAFASEVEIIINSLITFATKISILKDQLETYVNKIKNSQAENHFSPVLDPLGIIPKFVAGIEEGSTDVPSLLNVLSEILYSLEENDFSSADSFSELSKLYIENPLTNVRGIDELYTGLLMMNQALSLPQAGEDLSFYQGIDMLGTLAPFLEMIPEIGNIENLKSFLSNDNPEPESVQIIVKQLGF